MDKVGKGQVGQTGKVALKHTHYHVSHRQPVGSRCVTSHTAKLCSRELDLVFYDNLEGWDEGSGVAGRLKNGGICVILTGDSCCCMEETNTTL